MLAPDELNVLARARTELAPYQSNVMAKLADGSELRAVFNGLALEDFDLGEPFHSPVVDFRIEDRWPVGGFWPGRAP